MKIGIPGCTGRVGSLLVSELLSGDWPGLQLAGGTSRKGKNGIAGASYFVTDSARALFEKSDLIIDFTLPEATREHIELAKELKKPILIATTGLTPEDETAIGKLAMSVPVLYAANTSIAVNVLAALVEKAAKAMGPEFDIEIVEAHHKHKLDAPSGTAIMLGRTAAQARGIEFEPHAVISREGHTGERKSGDIGFATVRGGDAAGEHTVYFLGDGERLELKQQASNRSLYAKGALKSAIWLKEQPAGLYSMRDVLGL